MRTLSVRKRLQRFIYAPVLHTRARRLSPHILEFLAVAEKVLDVGCGDMYITRRIQQLHGRDVVGVDVVDNNLTELPLILYDGKRLPFGDCAFDAAYAILTLHHCDDEVQVLKEILRVAPRVLIIEEIYRNALERHYTFLNDWVMNHLESFRVSIPFHFHSDDEWKSIFGSLGSRVLAERRVWQLPVFPPTYQKLYVVERNHADAFHDKATAAGRNV